MFQMNSDNRAGLNEQYEKIGVTNKFRNWVYRVHRPCGPSFHAITWACNFLVVQLFVEIAAPINFFHLSPGNYHQETTCGEILLNSPK
jgi:hypothetical protein